MHQITHTSLERLIKFVESAPHGHLDRNDLVTRNSHIKLLRAKHTESKFLYAVTLRYPTITVEQSVIKWIIKNLMPTEKWLGAFHEQVL